MKAVNRYSLSLGFIFIVGTSAQAAECQNIPDWVAKTYPEKGTQVKKDNTLFASKWWAEKNHIPGAAGWVGEPWQNLGQCAEQARPWWEAYSEQEGFTDALRYIHTSLDELRKNPERAQADSQDARTPLYWLKRTMHMYPLTEHNTYNMPIVHESSWYNSRYGNMGRGIFFYTRTLGHKGNSVTIKTGDIPPGSLCYAATSATFNNVDTLFTSKVKLASNKETLYNFDQTGVLALGCSHPEKQQNGKFVQLKIEGGAESNLHIFGQNTQEDWEQQKLSADLFGGVVLYDGKGNHFVPKKITDRTQEIINKSLGESLSVAALYEKINGLDGSAEMFTASEGSLFLNYSKCCNAEFREGSVNVGFFDDKTTRANGAHWGLWHELAHQNEPRWEFDVFPEIQVNRYSVLACRMLAERNDFDYGKNCKLGDNTEWDKDAVRKFLASEIRYADFPKNQHDVALGFFTNLLHAYDESFYPNINRQRLKQVFAAPGKEMVDKYKFVLGTKQKVIDFNVVAYSREAEQDLREYFTRWGLHFSDAASRQVADMNLPKP
ncbi:MULTISPECIES: M60 family metallopeptidase [unclassified Serratia (in: enterobacteria)]|uniref:M60 family metallopeptidase n=1 Tax=unclassified Serratia (in: enterobacteria) TaxID=2647522 RepID=UPI002ED636BC|nr:M60 family metallopeptidase [Serratia sp. C2(2)]MEE4445392.1 M60 family metallopeptidase [Serratia sp. C2(1)]